MGARGGKGLERLKKGTFAAFFATLGEPGARGSFGKYRLDRIHRMYRIGGNGRDGARPSSGPFGGTTSVSSGPQDGLAAKNTKKHREKRGLDRIHRIYRMGNGGEGVLTQRRGGTENRPGNPLRLCVFV